MIKSLLLTLTLSCFLTRLSVAKFLNMLIKYRSCENNPQSDFALDPDTDQYCFNSTTQSKRALLNFLNLLTFKLLLALKPLQLKMQVSILKKNSNNFEVVFSLQNIPTIHFNSLVKHQL